MDDADADDGPDRQAAPGEGDAGEEVVDEDDLA